MTRTVGIPRALLFYAYYPLWISFFEELGAKVVLSEKTNKKIFEDGIEYAVDEACIPIKLFHGHVIDLKDKVDYLFIPRIKSLAKNEYICPKFCGLPEMIKYSIKDLPTVISTEINFFKSKKNLKNTVYEIGKYFANDYGYILHAYDKAYLKYKSYQRSIQREVRIKNKKKIMMLGHPYHLYDPYLNMHAIEKMKSKGIDVLTPEMIHPKIIDGYAKSFEGNLYWTFARKLIGTAKYLIHRKNVDGIIYVSTFGCGIDSVVGDIVEKYIRRESNIPFMMITLDEHSAETGVNTRMEAFIDMMNWRDGIENNISTHG